MVRENAEGRQKHRSKIAPERAGQVVIQLLEGRIFFERENAKHKSQQQDGENERVLDHIPIPGRFFLTEYLGPFIRNPPRCEVGSRRNTESRSIHSKTPVPQAKCTLAAKPNLDSSMQPMASRFLN